MFLDNNTYAVVMAALREMEVRDPWDPRWRKTVRLLRLRHLQTMAADLSADELPTPLRKQA